MSYEFISKDEQLKQYSILCKSLMNIQGFTNLLNYLERIQFYDHPSSTKYHGAYPSGLLHHSVNVALLFKNLCSNNNIDIPERTWIICGLFHDTCKAKQRTEGWHHKGHAKLSLSIIEEFIELTDLEKEIIKYHMGYYGTYEFNAVTGEYSLQELSNANNDFIVCLFHYADMITSRCYEG